VNLPVHRFLQGVVRMDRVNKETEEKMKKAVKALEDEF
jgi:hypothetical protein